MKKRYFIIIQLIVAAVETILLFGFALQDTDSVQDAVAVNEVLQSVEADWGRLESHENRTGLAYVVLDDTGEVLYRTDPGLSESINAAVVHRDTILDVESGGLVVGKLILSNDSAEFLKSRQQTVLLAVLALMLVQWSVCIGYGIYLDRIVVRPFRRLKDFARRVAGGNLDIPLAMDRGNLFGAFTESFDIMRDELKKARLAEAKANAEKKELVAKLSHDIRTPVASIKAASEVGAALAENDRIKGNYGQIIRKADQIDTLVNNLFTAALEELEQLSAQESDLPEDFDRQIERYGAFMCFVTMVHAADDGCRRYLGEIRRQMRRPRLRACMRRARFGAITVKSRITLMLLRANLISPAYWFLRLCRWIKSWGREMEMLW